MKKRSVVKVIIFTLITLGIYGIVWMVKTKREMNALGAKIPTAWWMIVPIANIWWGYKYAEGVGVVTKGKVNTILAFILLYALNIVGVAILQNEYNQLPATAKAVK